VSIDQTLLTSTRTLAFLFTDVEGSTRLWERVPAAMRVALADHDRILAQAVAAARGQVVKTTGDGIMAAFETAGDGVAACLTAQRGLMAHAWGETGPLRVRMGLHVGEGTGDGSDYHGPAVNRAARIMAAGHGGQVLLSGPTAALVIDRLPPGAELRDLGEHLLKDLARPERLYQLDYPSMPASFLPLATADARVGTLPSEPTAFVGREAERARLVERLGDRAIRLLTLTGPGGIGKTRLALRAAHDVAASFRSGAAFIDLSAARDTASALSMIARQLGLRDASEQAQLDELITRLRSLHLLLILDNVEQVSGAATTLLRMVADCPELTLLVTSREPLHVRGEHVLVVPPLGVPSSPGASSAAQLARFEAVLLFVERAREVKPEFRVTDDNAALVADICRRLEGLPLAIELAAARLRVFSLETLRDRLGSRLRALGSGPRDLPERQQTLRATIDWSYQLLPSAEQRLLTVLACFSGADIDAVEAVIDDLGAALPDVDAVDGLLSLSDKSLLRQIDQEDGTARFEMLETVREYALEQLDLDPDLARRARTSHARYFGRWTADRTAAVGGPDRAEALKKLSDEVENLRSAWRCGVVERDLPLLEALLAGLERLYDARGWYRALAALADDALSVVDTLAPSPDRDALTVRLRSDQARALTAMEGYTDEVEAAYERLLGSLDGSDVPQVYPVLRSLASLYSFRNDHARAVETGRQMLAIAERTGDPAMRVEGHLFVGTGTSFTGRIEDGLSMLEAGVAWFEANPYQPSHHRLGPDTRVSSLTALSLLLWWQGRVDTSLDRSRQALELATRLDHPSTSGYALFHAALLRLWRGEPDEARGLAVRVIELADEHELRIWSATGTVIVGCAAVAMGIGDEGLRWVTEGLDRYRGLRTPPVFWPFLLQLRAEASRRAGEIADGLASVTEGLTIAPYMPDLHLVHADLLRDAGDDIAAAASYTSALGAAHGWGAATSELRAAVRLCRLADASAAVRAERLDRLRDVYATLTEGLDSPDLVAARALLAGTESHGLAQSGGGKGVRPGATPPGEG
jgi:predicted ATPase/class 3 adenylate cyclase